MAESKKSLVLFNTGLATHQLRPLVVPDGKDAEGKEKTKNVPRTLGPNSSIEALNEEEFKMMLGYPHIKDAGKMVPANTSRIEALQAEVAEKDKTIAELRDQLAEKGKKGK